MTNRSVSPGSWPDASDDDVKASQEKLRKMTEDMNKESARIKAEKDKNQ